MQKLPLMLNENENLENDHWDEEKKLRWIMEKKSHDGYAYEPTHFNKFSLYSMCCEKINVKEVLNGDVFSY